MSWIEDNLYDMYSDEMLQRALEERDIEEFIEKHSEKSIIEMSKSKLEKYYKNKNLVSIEEDYLETAEGIINFYEKRGYLTLKQKTALVGILDFIYEDIPSYKL